MTEPRKGWTPGRWITKGDGVVRIAADPPSDIFDMPLQIGSGWRENAWCDDSATPEVRANANLIAAAPDLYEACAKAEEFLQTLSEHDYVAACPVITVLNDALARARGEVA